MSSVRGQKRKPALMDLAEKVEVPPVNPKKIPTSRKVVFVDPDDTQAPWWWPALVVPKNELKLFMSTVEGDMEEPGPGQVLVCYFEDGSFSIVPESDTIPFCPYRPPYTTYTLGPNFPAFRSDKSILLATLYWETGVVPPSFAWLKNQPPEDRRNLDTVPLKEMLDQMKLRSLQLLRNIENFNNNTNNNNHSNNSKKTKKTGAINSTKNNGGGGGNTSQKPSTSNPSGLAKSSSRGRKSKEALIEDNQAHQNQQQQEKEQKITRKKVSGRKRDSEVMLDNYTGGRSTPAESMTPKHESLSPVLPKEQTQEHHEQQVSDQDKIKEDPGKVEYMELLNDTGMEKSSAAWKSLSEPIISNLKSPAIYQTSLDENNQSIQEHVVYRDTPMEDVIVEEKERLAVGGVDEEELKKKYHEGAIEDGNINSPIFKNENGVDGSNDESLLVDEKDNTPDDLTKCFDKSSESEQQQQQNYLPNERQDKEDVLENEKIDESFDGTDHPSDTLLDQHPHSSTMKTKDDLFELSDLRAVDENEKVHNLDANESHEMKIDDDHDIGKGPIIEEELQVMNVQQDPPQMTFNERTSRDQQQKKKGQISHEQEQQEKNEFKMQVEEETEGSVFVAENNEFQLGAVDTEESDTLISNQHITEKLEMEDVGQEVSFRESNDFTSRENEQTSEDAEVEEEKEKPNEQQDNHHAESLEEVPKVIKKEPTGEQNNEISHSDVANQNKEVKVDHSNEPVNEDVEKFNQDHQVSPSQIELERDDNHDSKIESPEQVEENQENRERFDIEI